MSFFKTKPRKTDRLFSQYIRGKVDYRCEYCGKDCSEKKQGIHASHYFGRRKESVRFDTRNVHAFCFSCHDKLGHGEDRDKYKEFMISKLGEQGFAKLLIDSNTTKKRDDVLDELYIRELLKEIKD